MDNEGSEVITRDDQELFLDPVLGCDYMVELMQRDREAWKQVGTLITQAFAAGKAAQRAAPSEDGR